MHKQLIVVSILIGGVLPLYGEKKIKKEPVITVQDLASMATSSAVFHYVSWRNCKSVYAKMNTFQDLYDKSTQAFKAGDVNGFQLKHDADAYLFASLHELKRHTIYGLPEAICRGTLVGVGSKVITDTIVAQVQRHMPDLLPLPRYKLGGDNTKYYLIWAVKQGSHIALNYIVATYVVGPAYEKMYIVRPAYEKMYIVGPAYEKIDDYLARQTGLCVASLNFGDF